MANTDRRPPSLGWIAVGAVVAIVAVWFTVSAVLGLIFGFFKFVFVVFLAIAAITFVVGRKGGGR